MGGRSNWRAALIVGCVGAMLTWGCGKGADPQPPPAGGNGAPGVTVSGNSGQDAGTGQDGGITDAGGNGDAATDGGTDAGTDAGASGTPDGGTTGTPDAGRSQPFAVLTPGPWPTDNMQIAVSAAPGAVHETPVVGVTTDESQNLWVATNSALYLRRPGDAAYTRYEAKDGLHLQSNPVYYDEHYGLAQSHVPGAAVDPGISEIVGGGPNEVFVGYYGDESGVGDDTDPGRHSGKIDRVRVNADGSLTVDRFDLVSVDHGMQYWHNRTVQRMVFDHFAHPHTLFVGTNHGVDLLFPDKFRYPNPGEWIDTVNKEWMGDHLHPHVCVPRYDQDGNVIKNQYGVAGCPENGDETGQMMGDWRGLALLPSGDVWVAGRWTAGIITWDSDPLNWIHTSGKSRFPIYFGDGYPWDQPNEYGFVNEPVFRVPQEGDPIDLSAVTIAKDGRVWFSTQNYSADPLYGIAVWDGHHFVTYMPSKDLGMPEDVVRDLVGLPDGRLVLAFPNSGLAIWNPADPDLSHVVRIRAGSGIPDDHVIRLELDTMVDPPALHVSTWGGGAVLRKLP